MKILILLILVSCASQKMSVSRIRQSTTVLDALRKAGITPVETGKTKFFNAINVSCLRDLNIEIWKCSFTNSGQTYAVPTIESAALSGILVTLPVPKGDSGVATSFIQCREFDSDPESADCDIAISLDYRGP